MKKLIIIMSALGLGLATISAFAQTGYRPNTAVKFVQLASKAKTGVEYVVIGAPKDRGGFALLKKANTTDLFYTKCKKGLLCREGTIVFGASHPRAIGYVTETTPITLANILKQVRMNATHKKTLKSYCINCEFIGSY